MIRGRRLKIVQTLIKLQANVNFYSWKLQMTPLHWAAYNGDTAVVRLLLDNGAKPQINALDNTPVDLAGFSRSVEVVKMFCDWLQNNSSLVAVKSHK